MVWVFKGTRKYPGFPSAVFSTLDLAEDWIRKNKLEGVLTQYPVDVSVYDWAREQGLFEPDDPEEAADPTLVGNFSSGHQAHYHYEDGIRR